MIIVTAGNKYLDIDAYASGIAYSVLLNSLGKESVFATSAKLNMSVCSLIKDLGYKVETKYQPKYDDKFIIVDLSNPEFFDNIVDINNIIEVIDHHTGFERYWKDQNCKNQIEFIGSVATIIYEKFVENNKTNLLDSNLCKLLVSAILDNTLNLKSSITSKRDIEAYEQLKKLGALDKSFDDEYFTSCQQSINEDVVGSVRNDVKIENVSQLLPRVFGQLTIYNKEPIFEKLNEISSLFNDYHEPWLLNIICIKDGKSYIYSSDSIAKNNLELLFDSKFDNDILTLPKFMLRKEIMKMARNKVEG